MVEARQKAAWDHTALLAMLIAEPNRNADVRPQPFTVATFHPYMDDDLDRLPRTDVMPYNPAILEQAAKGNV